MAQDTQKGKKTRSGTQSRSPGKVNSKKDNKSRPESGEKTSLAPNRMDFLLSQSPQVIYAVEPTGNFRTTFISPNVRRVLGYDPEDFYSDSAFWTERIHPEDRERAANDQCSAVEHGCCVREYRFLNSDGDYIWMRDKETLLRDPDGNPLELIGYWTDIDAEMKARYEQAESEARYRSLVHFSPDGIFVIQKSRIVFANPALFSLVGASSDSEVLGRHPLDFIHPDHHGQAESRYTILTEQRRSAPPAEFRLLRLDGGAVDVELTSSPVPYQGDIAIQTIVRDISSRKRNARELSLLKKAVDQVGSIVMLTDRQGIIEYGNQACMKATGYSGGRLIGMNISNFKGLSASEQEQMWKTLNSKGEWRGRFTNLTSNGRTYCEAAAISAVRNELGEITHFMKVADDITAQERRESELREKNNTINAILASSPVGIGLFRNQATVWANQAMCSMLGYNEDELLGCSGEILYPDVDGYRRAEQELWGDIDRGRTGRTETQWKRRDGSVFHCYVQGSPLDASDPSRGVILAVTDLTERKLAESTLEKSERHYRLLAENIVDVISLMDLNLRPVYISPSVKSLLDYTPEEFMARSFKDIFTPSSYELIMKTWESEALRGMESGREESPGRTVRLELEQTRKNGTTIWTEVILRRMLDGDGKPNGILSVTRDISDRKLAEEALIRERDFNVALVESSQDAIFTINLGWELTSVNPSFITRFGYPADRVVGQSIELLHVSRQAFIEDRRAIRAAIRKTGTWQGELRYRKRDGTVFPVEQTISELKLPDGSAAGYVAMVRDITESKKAERQIIRQSRLLEAVNEVLTGTLAAESVSEVAAICVAVAERLTGCGYGWIGEVNQAGLLDKIAISDSGRAACRMVKTSKAKTIEKNLPLRSFWKLVLEEGRSVLTNDSASHSSAIGVPKGHPEISTFLGVPLKRSGETYGLIALANKKGGFDHRDQEDVEVLSIAFTESLDRMRTQQAMMESRQRLKDTIDSVTAGILIIDAETRTIIDANPYALSMIGASRQQVLGKVCHSFVCPTGEKECPVLDLDQTVDSSERGLLNADGHEKPILKTVTPVRFNDRDCLLETFIDISERKQLEAQLFRAQKMEAIGTLAGGIAHDFNNILTVILGYSQLSINEVVKGSDLHRNLNQAIKAGIRARDLVDQILAISRHVETGAQPVMISSMVKEVLKFLKASTPANIELRHNITTEYMITADPTKLHQVMMNLCTNAVQAMEDTDGVLEVDLSELYLDPATAATQFPGLAPGPFVEMIVSDTGPGMTPEVMDRVFEPYFTTKKEGQGTGLGLAVVHGIVEAHGGSVKVSSQPGKGTTFQVLLPATTDKGMAVVHPEIPYCPLEPGRILFVDDEREIVEVARRMLEPMGYLVTATTSAKKALEIFSARPDDFDLVITDMTMPDINGYQLAHRLMAVRSDIPVILCTGFNKRISEEKALSAGLRGFIMKPLEIDSLCRTIHKVLYNRLCC